LVTPLSGRGDFRCPPRERSVAFVQPQTAELLAKLTQVEQNAWLLFNELPPCVAKTRALHVFLDAQAIKARLEPVLEPERDVEL
jgi:hypothetical protein